jgi:hypothetical protein
MGQKPLAASHRRRRRSAKQTDVTRISRAGPGHYDEISSGVGEGSESQESRVKRQASKDLDGNTNRLPSISYSYPSISGTRTRVPLFEEMLLRHPNALVIPRAARHAHARLFSTTSNILGDKQKLVILGSGWGGYNVAR